MSIGRRDLLKFFGAGAVIAPVIQGVAMAEGHAKLIEVPKVEIATPPKLVECNGTEFFVDRDQLVVTVFARNPRTNRVMRMDCDAFITKMNFHVPVQGVAMRECEFIATGPVQIASHR